MHASVCAKLLEDGLDKFDESLNAAKKKIGEFRSGKNKGKSRTVDDPEDLSMAEGSPWAPISREPSCAAFSSAWKSGPVPVFYHFGGGLQPDRSSIKGNSQKTGPKPKKLQKTGQNQFELVYTNTAVQTCWNWS